MPPPPDCKVDAIYLVVAEGADGVLFDAITVKLWRSERKAGSKTSVWLHVSDGRSRSWSALGSASGGGYNLTVAALEDAFAFLVGHRIDFSRSGGSADREADGLAALAVAAGLTPRLVVRV